MTDTVNVPQEMIDAVMKVAVGVDEYGSEVFPGPFVAAELVRVALAAAPKAEPVSPAPDSDELLEALEPDFLAACAAAVADEYPATSQSLHYYALKQSDLIAKHKGPQS